MFFVATRNVAPWDERKPFCTEGRLLVLSFLLMKPDLKINGLKAEEVTLLNNEQDRARKGSSDSVIQSAHFLQSLTPWAPPPPETWFLGSSGNCMQLLGFFCFFHLQKSSCHFHFFMHFWMFHAILSGCSKPRHNATKHSTFIYMHTTQWLVLNWVSSKWSRLDASVLLFWDPQLKRLPLKNTFNFRWIFTIGITV